MKFAGVRWYKLFINEEDRYALNEEETRVILLFDLDSFEVQVYQRADQIGLPRVVTCSNGRIIAVSSEAKAYGIGRNSTPFFWDAQKLCPNLIRINQPTTGTNNRPDKTFAKSATANVVNSIKNYLSQLEPSPIFEFSTDDEFYVDITEYVDSYRKLWFNKPIWFNTKIYSDLVYFNDRAQKIKFNKKLNEIDNDLEWQDVRLAYGATIGANILNDIKNKTGFESSFGIGSNKLVAKMGSGDNKPFGITVITPSGFQNFCDKNDFTVIHGLGGKKGDWLKNEFGNLTISMFQNLRHRPLAYSISEYNNSSGIFDDNEFVQAVAVELSIEAVEFSTN